MPVRSPDHPEDLCFHKCPPVVTRRMARLQRVEALLHAWAAVTLVFPGRQNPERLAHVFLGKSSTCCISDIPYPRPRMKTDGEFSRAHHLCPALVDRPKRKSPIWLGRGRSVQVETSDESFFKADLSPLDALGQVEFTKSLIRN